MSVTTCSQLCHTRHCVAPLCCRRRAWNRSRNDLSTNDIDLNSIKKFRRAAFTRHASASLSRVSPSTEFNSIQFNPIRFDSVQQLSGPVCDLLIVGRLPHFPCGHLDRRPDLVAKLSGQACIFGTLASLAHPLSVYVSQPTQTQARLKFLDLSIDRFLPIKGFAPYA